MLLPVWQSRIRIIQKGGYDRFYTLIYHLPINQFPGGRSYEGAMNQGICNILLQRIYPIKLFFFCFQIQAHYPKGAAERKQRDRESGSTPISVRQYNAPLHDIAENHVLRIRWQDKGLAIRATPPELHFHPGC